MADIKQWVNLPKDAKWAGHLTAPDKPTDEERVGPIHLRVKFKSTKHANFKTRVKQVGADPRYNKKEQARNENFEVRYANAPAQNSGKNEVILERDIYLLAAGGAEFTFEAKHRKKKVEVPKTIETRRALFYYSVVQDSSGSPDGTDPTTGATISGAIDDPSPILTKLESEHWTSDHPYYIWLEKKGDAVVRFTDALRSDLVQNPAGAVDPSAAVSYDSDNTNLLWRNQSEQLRLGGGNPFTPLGPNDAVGPGATRTDPTTGDWLGVVRHETQWEMFDAIKGAVNRGDAQALKPYCFVIVWCNYIAKRAKRIIKYKGTSLKGNTNVSLAGSWVTKLFSAKRTDEELYIALGSWAWHGFNAADDANKSWLISISCRFIPKSGAPENVTVHKIHVDLHGNPNYPFGGYNWIKVKLKAADLDGLRNRIFNLEGEFEFTVTYYAAHSFTCGYAMPGVNVVVVCDKATWRKMTPDEKHAIIAHELGHAIGMTAQGGKPTSETFNAVAATTPDFPGTLYGNIQNGRKENSCGHQGNHCRKGAVWNRGAWDATANNSGGGKGRYQGTWTGTPECTMFGQIGLGGKTNPSTYCGTCKPIVRKLDLGGELFASCVTD